MKKISRRDYLARMGTGLLAVGSASDLFAKEHSPKSDPDLKARANNRPGPSQRSKSRKGLLSKPFERWPVTNDVPYLPSVLVYFWGLVAFAHKGAGVTEVGFYSKDVDHKLGVAVFENCTLKYETPVDGFPDQSLFTLGIEGRSPDSRFYQAPGNFNRKSNSPALRHDFRWLPDLESDEFYNRVIPIKPGFYTKRLLVNHGTFLTHLRSESKFDIAGGPKPKADVYWARMMTLQIALAPQEQVKLEIPGAPPFRFSKGAQTEIYFVNQCYHGSSMCSGSDFDLNFEATTLSSSSRFKLNLKQKQQGLATGTCMDSFVGKLMSPMLLNTDEAPCMGSGYGQGGLPSFPPG